MESRVTGEGKGRDPGTIGTLHHLCCVPPNSFRQLLTHDRSPGRFQASKANEGQDECARNKPCAGFNFLSIPKATVKR